jgi:hypothetical protein
MMPARWTNSRRVDRDARASPVSLSRSPSAAATDNAALRLRINGVRAIPTTPWSISSHTMLDE